MMLDLIVTDDLPGAAMERILLAAPRTLALAGGSTPRGLYERLVKAPLPWAEIDVFFSDERCVPPDHPDSNYGMAQRALLGKVPARVHRMCGEACEAEAYERLLRERVAGDPPSLDVVLLGLGADGHTASLFSGDAALEERERLVLRVERPDATPGGGVRLTLTLPVLNAAREAIFLVAGAGKREALSQLRAGEGIPAVQVRAGRVTVVATSEAVA